MPESKVYLRELSREQRDAFRNNTASKVELQAWFDPYEDSVFDKVIAHGIDSGRPLKEKDLFRHTQKSLTDEQRTAIQRIVKGELSRQLQLRQFTLRTGQVVYRNRLGQFAALRRDNVESEKSKKKIPEAKWRSAQNA